MAPRDGEDGEDRGLGPDGAGSRVGLRDAGDHGPPRRGRWVLNGEKRWIGNATFADLVIIWARDVEDGQVKAFMLEKDENGEHHPGYSTELIKGKMGKRAVWQPDIYLEDVRVPDENRLEGANSFKDTNKVLTATRSGVAWEAIGHAIAAYEAALQYAQERVQFGKPIASFQLIQNKLSGMLAEITNMQLMCFRLAQLQEQGKMTDRWPPWPR